MTRQVSMRGRKPKPGRITFVGSGPGDPGLLTTRARTVLANAALEAVRKWRFEPAAMESSGVVDFKFEPRN